MASPDRTIPSLTRQRLLEAAERVFALKGLEGATTREIARRAKVNEVTLFRHFQSKEKLLGEVLRRTFDRKVETAPAESAFPLRGLRADLQRFARRYAELLQPNILLIRTLLAEIHRHRAHEMRVLKGIFAPLKADLVAAIEAARKSGGVRTEIEPIIAADQFASMIFFDVLRRSGLHKPEYTPARYFDSAVETFARGIES